MKRPPRGVVRTVEQVAEAVVTRAGGKAIDINVSRTAALTSLLKTLAPPLYRKVMSDRAIPL